MAASPTAPTGTFTHRFLNCGAEFAAEALPDRKTVAMCFRMLSGLALEPGELAGIGSIVERTLAKGTENYSGRELADAFDQCGAGWGTACGRQTMLLRVTCLPEFAARVVDLVAEVFCRPVFPEDACRVAVRLAAEERKHLEDDPQDVLRLVSSKLIFGEPLGRYVGGEPETLERITPEAVREHWRRAYHAGRMQIVAAGAVDAEALAKQIDERFDGLGDATPAGRDAAQYTFRPGTAHEHKDLKQEYMHIALRGAAREDERYAVEQVLLAILSGGMSARLFTEVREKQGLVYWVGAWHEQPKGSGLIHLGASTTPQRCRRTYETLLRELERVGEDVTVEESDRARNQLVAHYQTESDLTRARAYGLSDDLFHFGRPIGLAAKLERLQAVDVEDVRRYAQQLRRDELCVATVGPEEFTQ